MKTYDFLEQFMVIEGHLFSLAPDFNKRQGLFNLLKYLKSNNKLGEDLLSDIFLVMQTRNKIMSTPSLSKDISDDIANKITDIKSKLGI